MWAAIISAVAAVFKAVAVFISKRRDEMLVSLGRSKQSNVDLQGRIDALKEANRLRNEAESRVQRDDAGGVPVDDGFERKSDD
jgi:hypothetical protein